MKKLNRFINKTESGYATLSIMFALMGMLVIMLMSHQHAIDDALAEATLAACIVSEDSYYKDREETVQDPNDPNKIVYNTIPSVKFSPQTITDNSRKKNVPNGILANYMRFTQCMQDEIDRSNKRFFSDYQLENITFYEVDKKTGSIKIWTNGNYDADHPSEINSVGSVFTPAGKQVTETSVYSKISFNVHAYYMFNVTKRVNRDFYAEIRSDVDIATSFDDWTKITGPNP